MPVITPVSSTVAWHGEDSSLLKPAVMTKQDNIKDDTARLMRPRA